MVFPVFGTAKGTRTPDLLIRSFLQHGNFRLLSSNIFSFYLVFKTYRNFL